MNVQTIMSSPVHTCERDQTAQSALRAMRDHDCGCVVVVDEGVVVGIVTDRDIALALADLGKAPGHVHLAQIMTGYVFVVRPESSIQEAEGVMRQQHIRRVPVVDDDSRPVGLLSLHDIARAGDERGWKKSDDGLSAHNVSTTLADICRTDGYGGRAMV
jgi:CBS domain-containing protein